MQRVSAPSEILGGWLFLGNKQHAIMVGSCAPHVSCVLNVVGGGVPDEKYLRKLKEKSVSGPMAANADVYLMSPMCDYGSDNLVESKRIAKMLNFIDACRARGDKILIHCRMGVNRSTTIVLLYLVKRQGWTLTEALLHVAKIHPIGRPHPLYMEQLTQIDEHRFPFLHLPRGIQWKVLVLVDERCLKSFRCTHSGAVQLIHDSYRNQCANGAVALQRAWRRRMGWHLLSNIRGLVMRELELTDLTRMLSSRSDAVRKALAIGATFRMLVLQEANARSGKLLARRPILCMEFLDTYFDPKFFSCRLDMIVRLESATMRFIASFHPLKDEYRPLVASTCAIPLIIRYMEELFLLYRQRIDQLNSAACESLEYVSGRLEASSHPLDADFVEACKPVGVILTCGLGMGEFSMLKMLCERLANNCGPRHFDATHYMHCSDEILNRMTTYLREEKRKVAAAMYD